MLACRWDEGEGSERCPLSSATASRNAEDMGMVKDGDRMRRSQDAAGGCAGCKSWNDSSVKQVKTLAHRSGPS